MQAVSYRNNHYDPMHCAFEHDLDVKKEFVTDNYTNNQVDLNFEVPNSVVTNIVDKSTEGEWNWMKVHVGFDVTRKGERSLVIDGYKFTKSRDGMSGRVFWRCSRRECKATAVTVSNKVEHVRAIHSHPPPVAAEFFANDSTRSEQEVRFNNLVTRVRRRSQPNSVSKSPKSNDLTSDSRSTSSPSDMQPLTNKASNICNSESITTLKSSLNDSGNLCRAVNPTPNPTSIAHVTVRNLSNLVNNWINAAQCNESNCDESEKLISTNNVIDGLTTMDLSGDTKSFNASNGSSPGRGFPAQLVSTIRKLCTDLEAGRVTPDQLESLNENASNTHVVSDVSSSNSPITSATDEDQSIPVKCDTETLVQTNPVQSTSSSEVAVEIIRGDSQGCLIVFNRSELAGLTGQSSNKSDKNGVPLTSAPIYNPEDTTKPDVHKNGDNGSDVNYICSLLKSSKSTNNVVHSHPYPLSSIVQHKPQLSKYENMYSVSRISSESTNPLTIRCTEHHCKSMSTVSSETQIMNTRLNDFDCSNQIQNTLPQRLSNNSNLFVHWKKEKLRESIEEVGTDLFPLDCLDDKDGNMLNAETYNDQTACSQLCDSRALNGGKRSSCSEFVEDVNSESKRSCVSSNLKQYTSNGEHTIIGDDLHHFSSSLKLDHPVLPNSYPVPQRPSSFEGDSYHYTQIQDDVLIKVINTVQQLTAKLDADADPPEVIQNCRAIQACLDTIAAIKRARSNVCKLNKDSLPSIDCVNTMLGSDKNSYNQFAKAHPTVLQLNWTESHTLNGL